MYVWDKGWAFVDAVEKLLRFADGETLLISDVLSSAVIGAAGIPFNCPFVEKGIFCKKTLDVPVYRQGDEGDPL